jgi:hypothetical protein
MEPAKELQRLHLTGLGAARGLANVLFQDAADLIYGSSSSRSEQIASARGLADVRPVGNISNNPRLALVIGLAVGIPWVRTDYDDLLHFRNFDTQDFVRWDPKSWQILFRER